jgi:hypothetical protein
MARQYVKVRGVGGGRAGSNKPSKPSAPKLAVRRLPNAKRKA